MVDVGFGIADVEVWWSQGAPRATRCTRPARYPVPSSGLPCSTSLFLTQTPRLPHTCPVLDLLTMRTVLHGAMSGANAADHVGRWTG
eukprot:259425-Rhodomonas_salina.2